MATRVVEIQVLPERRAGSASRPLDPARTALMLAVSSSVLAVSLLLGSLSISAATASPRGGIGVGTGGPQPGPAPSAHT